MRNGYTRLSRRGLLLAAMSAPLAGCDLDIYGMNLGSWTDAIGISSGLKASPAVTRDQAADIPYATIGFRVGDAPESVLILANKSQQDSLWVSAQHLAILTTNGRIRKTSGFPWNLSNTVFVENDPVGISLLTLLPSQRFERICDFSDVDRFEIRISSTFEVQGKETISILGADLDTIRVTENCRCDRLNWNFQNQYWVDSDNGAVWRSTQSVHPNADPFTIEVLRPEG